MGGGLRGFSRRGRRCYKKDERKLVCIEDIYIKIKFVSSFTKLRIKIQNHKPARQAPIIREGGRRTKCGFLGLFVSHLPNVLFQWPSLAFILENYETFTRHHGRWLRHAFVAFVARAFSQAVLGFGRKTIDVASHGEPFAGFACGASNGHLQ
jgi:hypothetical protein